MEFVKDFLIYEAGALCGFFIAALMLSLIHISEPTRRS